MSGEVQASRLVLGTVQFGLRYGISNVQGQVSPETVRQILSCAKSAGISTLDTAAAYGNSEQVLGSLNIGNWQVITKLPPHPEQLASVGDWVEHQLTESLERLQQPAIHGLLLHRPEQLLSPDHGKALYRALIDQRERGRIEKIGISIYAPHDLDSLPASMRFDIVQGPFNILDRRMLTSGWAKRLADYGCEFHSRSIFLQGLLLMPSAMRPAYFSQWDDIWARWEGWLAEEGITPLQACMRYVLGVGEVAKLVVGVENAQQVEEVIAAAAGRAPHAPAELCSEEPALVNPAMWQKK